MTEAWLWLAAVALALLGALLGVCHMRQRGLQDRLMRSWQRQADLQRALEVEQAARKQAQETYDRRVKRWCEYASNLQDVCVSLGTLTAWKADADRRAMPFVDSDVAPL